MAYENAPEEADYQGTALQQVATTGIRRRVIQRAENGQFAVEVGNDLLVCPDMIARGDHIDPGIKELACCTEGQPYPPGSILAIAHHKVNLVFITQVREDLLHRLPAGLANDVAYCQYFQLL